MRRPYSTLDRCEDTWAWARILAAGILLMVAKAAPSYQTDRIDVSGTWELKVTSAEGSATPTVFLIQQGEKITGTYTGRMGKTSLEGSLRGRDIKFVVTLKFQTETIVVTYTGTVEGDSMKGTVQFSNGGSGSWTARRARKS
jgi:hypothetical protein